ncbi:hypothetical protein GQ53DRAFT_407076 [Thozetella sp. PMI_491]|nr:hypothetical protein GQ53DRAFT_407076 [Thozetella sp. PMI_491]
MASLNLSINGPSIKSSYAGVVNGPAPSSSSSTYGQWALFSVQAPLANAFQDSGAKESVLKVESTGEGELADLVEDFNEGRIQFAFVKVKDPNSGLPKNVLIAWCGGGVPERTKGYFTSHVAAVAKVLHGYHVQITARSDSDLAPESIVQKVADASGAKYTAGGSAPLSSSGPPPVAKKPVFTPTTSRAAPTAFNPLVAARNRRQENVDDDGWGADAPQVTRTQVEKVQSAYKPTKVDIAALRQNRDESTSGSGSAGDGRDVIKGAYQPIGKVDIASIRAQARNVQDDRPTIVKGAYEPVGKVDIAAIRAKAQKPSEPADEPAAPPRSLAERSAAFNQSERITELPKPKVAKKFAGSSSFTGTKAPTPGGLGFGTPVNTGGGLGSAGRSFTDAATKTPAQIWAEKKAAQGGGVSATPVSPPMASPIAAQTSGSEWKSGYTGKSWATVNTSNFGRGGVEKHATGGTDEAADREVEPPSSGGGVSALKDRFKDAAPIGMGAPPIPRAFDDEPAPPPPPAASRPGAPSGGFALPGLPTRPPPADEEEEEDTPPIPNRDYDEPEPPSPVRIAVPVARGPEPDLEPAAQSLPPRPIPVPEDIPEEEELPREEEAYDPRAAAVAVAQQSLGHVEDVPPAAAAASGKRAVVQYDYEKAEDNEIELREGEYVTNIEMVDDDWWMGTNTQGESGLFPSNYVEIVDDDAGAAPAAQAAVPPPPPAAEPTPAAPAPASGGGPTATAQFDYEAAEDNELSFPEGATVTDLEFPDEDWWFGHYNGASGLFPANYVELNQ